MDAGLWAVNSRIDGIDGDSRFADRGRLFEVSDRGICIEKECYVYQFVGRMVFENWNPFNCESKGVRR